MPEHRPASSLLRWLSLLTGGVILLIGIILLGGGLWLALLGGSIYYLVTGLAMTVAGWLLLRQREAGAWLYIGIFLLTCLWAIWEAGFDAWPLVPRIVAPAVVLVPVVAIVALLRGRRRLAVIAPLSAVGGVALLFVGAATLGHSPWAIHGRPGPSDPAAASGLTLASDPLRTGSDWPAYGGTYHARRYSPLGEITPANVAGLERVWTYRTRDMPSEAANGEYSSQATPLKIGDRLYLCSAKNILISLDAATGREWWRHDPGVSDDAIPYSASCRGVAYHAVADATPGQPCATRILQGTLDARLIAVDAMTGQRCPDFGANGQVNLLEGIGDSAPGFYAVTSPPTIVRGVAVVGAQVLDGQSRDAPSGVVRGYDAATGELRWAWDMARPDRNGAPAPGETYTRGTPNMWTIATGDEALGQVYLPMGNSSVDYYGSDRLAQTIPFATALVALDVATGRPVWRFQTVRYDVWDYDLGSQATLIDYPVQGGTVPAVMLPSKQGDLYVLDRRTGQPLHSVIDRAVPGGGVEPERLSRTQPFSDYHTLARRDLAERDMWGMSPIDQLWCRIQFRRADYRGIYTPPRLDRPWIQYPGYNGGSDWGGIAVDPFRRVVIANYNDVPNYNRLLSRAEALERGWAPIDEAEGSKEGDPQEGVPYAVNVGAGFRVALTGIPCKEPPLGGIRAIDLATGETLWDRPLGTARRNGPFGIPSMLPFTIGTPNNGGSAVTASGLVFIAAATDNLIRAIDIRTGEVLWQDVLPAGGQATPIVYEANGRQFVVIKAGGHHFMETPIGDHLVAYALPPQQSGGG